jgi:hypothetical protein
MKVDQRGIMWSISKGESSGGGVWLIKVIIESDYAMSRKTY